MPFKCTCVVCGTEFESYNREGKYCSNACTYEAQKKRYREYREKQKRKRSFRDRVFCLWCKCDITNLPFLYRRLYCFKDCGHKYSKVRERIMNTFEGAERDRELARLLEKGCNYRFPQGYETLNGLYFNEGLRNE